MKLSKMEFFRAGILLGLEDVKGPTKRLPRSTCLSFPMPRQDSAQEYCRYLREGHLEIGDNSECALHNPNFTPLFTRVIPMAAHRKQAGFFSFSSSLSSRGKHKGDAQGLAINLRPHCLSLSRINSLEERSGPCPRQNPHHRNLKGHAETSPQHDEGLEPQ